MTKSVEQIQEETMKQVKEFFLKNEIAWLVKEGDEVSIYNTYLSDDSIFFEYVQPVEIEEITDGIEELEIVLMSAKQYSDPIEDKDIETFIKDTQEEHQRNFFTDLMQNPVKQDFYEAIVEFARSDSMFTCFFY